MAVRLVLSNNWLKFVLSETRNSCFAVTYTPKSQGNNAVGVPVQQTYSTGNYTVHVVSGTVSLEVLTDRLSEEAECLCFLWKRMILRFIVQPV